MAPGFTIPESYTRLVEVKDWGGYYKEITPEVYKVIKNVEHQEWLQREALEEFIQLDWTTPRYSLENIVEMSRTWDSVKKCCTVDGRIVDLDLDSLSSIFRLQGYGKKPRRNVQNWVSQFFYEAALRKQGYLMSACKSSDVLHRIKFVTLTLHVNWIRIEAPQSIVQAVEFPASRNPRRKDWLGMMAHAFWKAMDKSQVFSATTYVQVLLKAHLRIILDYVLRPDAVMPKSMRTQYRFYSRSLSRQRQILVPSAAQVETGGSTQIRNGESQVDQPKIVARTAVAKKEEGEEDVASFRAKQCNEPETKEEGSNGSQPEEEDTHESDSATKSSEEVIILGSRGCGEVEQVVKDANGYSDTNSKSASNKEGIVHGSGGEAEREAEQTPGGATNIGPDSPRETENEEMDVDPTPTTVDGFTKNPEFLAFAEPLVGRINEGLLVMFRESRREVNRERRERDSERIKSQNRVETLLQENHELQQQLNNYHLQEMQNQKSKAEEEAAWRKKHVQPILESLAVKNKDILALQNGATDMNVELNRVREQKAKCAKELTFYLCEKGRLEKEAVDLKAKSVEQEKRNKDLEARVEKAESELETTKVSLETSQKEENERDKSVARVYKAVKGLQGRVEKMPLELRKLYKLNLVPESKGSKKRKAEH